jgi:hypothetical protein
LVPAELEVALGGTRHLTWEGETAEEGEGEPRPGEAADPREVLSRRGWRLVDALDVGGDLDSYRDYIGDSMGEWSVAKHGYVKGSPGWFSCRSACYLACGRPAVVQDTGFSAALPTGKGLLSFETLDDAVAAIEEVVSHYPVHAEAARAIAEEHFGSDRVLKRLVDEAMR